jgi:predicted amidophosphoribosyltransferase
VQIFAGGIYVDEYRKLVLNWKDHGREDLDKLMRQIMSGVAQMWQSTCKDVGRKTIYIIPAPSAKASIAKRGKLQTLSLAKGVQSALSSSCKVKVVQVLRQKNTKKQVNFNSEQRSKNRLDALQIRKKLPANAQVLIVDDICTTGATMNACKRLLESEGYRVVGLLALATPFWGEV